MGNSQSDEFKPEDIQNSDLIFVAGGEDDSYHTLSTAWCYVVRTRKWLAIPPMLEPRKACAAATMQNSLYVAGGCTAGRLGVGGFGGGGANKPTSAAYNEEHALDASAKRGSDSFTNSSSSGNPHVLASVRRYNAELGRWEHDMPNMLRGRKEFGLEPIIDSFHGNTGCLIAVGGGGCERYDPRTRRWEEINDMDCKREGCSTAVFNGRLYCAGGWTGDTVHRSMEMYEPRMDAWLFMANMRERRRNFGFAALPSTSGGESGKLIATGGQNDYVTLMKDPTATCELYDVRNNRWEFAQCTLEAPKSYHTTVTANGTVYNLGGSKQGWKVVLKSTVKDFEALNEKGSKWKQISPSLPLAMSSHAAASVCCGEAHTPIAVRVVGADEVDATSQEREVSSAEAE